MNKLKQRLQVRDIEPDKNTDLYVCYIEELKIPAFREPSPIRVITLQELASPSVRNYLFTILND